MKKLKYLLFLCIIFLTPSVFAETSYDMTSRITSPVNYSECGSGSYTGVELNGSTNCWNTKTRYQGTLQRIYFNLPAPSGSTFENDTQYRLVLKMATQDWRNNFGTVAVRPGSSYSNNFVDTFSFVSQTQVNITFTVPYSGSTTYQTLWVDLQGRSGNLITGVSNWNLNSVVLTKISSGSSGGSTTPSGPTTTFDDTAIINNSKENTQDIINNNNTNTQDVINNNNNNTQEIIDNSNQNTQIIDSSLNSQCKNGPIILSDEYYMKDNYYLDENGNELQDSGAAISTYFVIKPNSTYTISSPGGLAGSAYSVCLYDSNKNILSAGSSRICQSVNDFSNGINTGAYAQYMRITIPKRWFSNVSLTGPICNNWEKDAIDNQTNAINETNEYLKDDTNPSISDSALNDVFGRVHFNDPLSYLLTLPTQLINQIVSMSDTCSSIDLGTLYGVHLILPCINLENHLGSDLWNTLDIILSVGLLSVILKNFYDTISNLLTLGGEKEAKEKFSMPTPMDFLAMILGGDRQ